MSNPHMLIQDEKYNSIFDSVKRLDERGVLYSVECNHNYYELNSMIDMLVGDAGCSTFAAKNTAGQCIMGRNYDYTHYKFNNETEKNEDKSGLAIVVKCNSPAAKYKSLGVADGFWLDVKNGSMFEGCLDNGKNDISALALIPFLCMDGINEAGLAVSIMALPTENRWDEIDYVDPDTFDAKQMKLSEKFIYDEAGKEPEKLNAKARSGCIAVNKADKKAWKVYKNFSTWQKEEGKQTVFHPVLMRLMLDNTATAKESAFLAQSVNVRAAMPDWDYHILVTDTTGESLVLEWIDNKLVVLPLNHATNFFAGREDRYGAGYDRDDILIAAQEKYKELGFSENCVKYALALSSQNSLDGSSKGFTQWSNLYNLEEKTLKMWLFMDYEKSFDFSI